MSALSIIILTYIKLFFSLFQKQCILPQSMDFKRNEDAGKLYALASLNEILLRHITTLDREGREWHEVL